MRELMTLWENTLGPAPPNEQFAIWAAPHTEESIRRAILKAATKNQTMGGKMDAGHKARFASRVMLTLTEQAIEHTANREKLSQEFEGQVDSDDSFR